MKQWYPTMGAVVGGGVGLVGPTGSALGAGGGALVGEVAKGNAEIEEARETISALTHGDVETLIEKGMEQHASGFESLHHYDQENLDRCFYCPPWLPGNFNICSKKMQQVRGAERTY